LPYESWRWFRKPSFANASACMWCLLILLYYRGSTDSFLLLLVSVRSRSLCRGFSPERPLTRAQHSIPFVLR
jgi:hypothetical protein